MPVDFQDYAQERNFDVDTYPGASAGQGALRVLKGTLVCAMIFAAIFFGLRWCDGLIQEEIDAGVAVPSIFVNLLSAAVGVVNVLLAISLVLAAASVILYGVCTLVRWRNYERDCFVSDLKAMSLKKNILKTLAVRRHIADIHEKHNKANRSSKELGGAKMSFEDQSKLNALMALNKMKVFVNKRQSLDDEIVEERYRVIIEAPFVQKESDDLQNLLKGFDQVATRMKKGQVSFGSQIISADQSKIEYMDAIVVPDKYSFEVISEDGRVEHGSYQSTFPLSLFIDKQEEIDRKSKQASRWAFRAANELDDLLTTMEMPAKRSALTCGAVNARFEYKMSFKLNEDKVDRIPEKIDKKFNTSGSTAESHGDSLTVTIALPSDYKKPINVPTLYRQVFG